MRFTKTTARVNGESRLFVFTMATLKDFCEYKGINPSNIGSEMTGLNGLESQKAIFYSAYRMGFVYNDEEPPKFVNQLKIDEFIDGIEQEEFDKVLKCFVASMSVPEPNEKKKEVTPKKKQPLTK